MEKRVKTLKSKEELSRSNDNGIEKRTREFMKKNKNEAGAVGTIVAKTLLKNIENYLKVVLEPEEEDKDNFYKSINLAGTLIIFKDAGSTAMDRNELLDYIAGLIDQDGVKMLVVLHADCDAELIKEISKRTSVNIIRYQADVPFIIKSVFDKYDHPVLRSLETEETIEEIVQCGREFHNRNIHAFFSACQKAVDVYRLMNTDTVQYDPDFLKTAFMGMLYYLARKRKGESVFWKDEDQLSFRLGGDRYPLFRFCYDFIMEGTMESDQIKKAQEVLRQFREYDEKTRSADSDLDILYSWYYQKEQDVADVVARITERLKDPDAFALQEYGRIASCMLEAEELLGCDISEAKELLVSNLTAKGMQVNSDFISRYLVPSADDPEAAVVCDDLKKKMLNALKKVDAQLFGFSYNPDEIEDFSRQIPKLKERIFHFGAFARTMHNGKLAEMIQHCSAKQIYDFHNAYAAVYRIPYSSAYLFRRQGLDLRTVCVSERTGAV